MNTLARCSLVATLAALVVSCIPSGPQKSDYLLGYERNNEPTGAGAHHPAPAIPDTKVPMIAA